MKASSVITLTAVIAILVITLYHQPCESARKGGSRRRGKHRRQHAGSTKLIALSPKMRAYYEHENGAEIVKSSHFDYEFELGHKIVFICVAKGDPAPVITWYKDGVEVFDHPFVQVSEWHQPDHRVKSKLEIDPACQMDAGSYECQASNKYRMDRKAFKADYVLTT